MKVVTASQMREIDRVTIDERGIPGEVLMYHAGYSVSRYILEKIPLPEHAVVLAGSGNNGGDGFVTAHFLNNAGIDVKIYTTGKPGDFSPSTDIYYKLCVNSGYDIEYLDDDTEITDLEKTGLLIDSLTGTGFSGKSRGILNRLIEIINRSGVPVVSVDMPSGLPSDGDAPEGNAVRADHTVTIGLPKVSLVTYPGKEYAGILEVSDIGFPGDLTGSESIRRELIDRRYAKRSLYHVAEPDLHKGERGHLLLMGGFESLEGAIMMTASAALETGVGLISLITTEGARKIIAGRIPELMTRSFDREEGKDEIQKLLDEREYRGMVIGPGMGRSEKAGEIFNNTIDHLERSGIKKVLIDGDGLFHLVSYLEKSTLPRGVEFIITPHFGEASRLMKRDVESIKRNRTAAAEELAGKTGAAVILKGPSSIVSGETGTFINTTGNAALSTGGTGDLLSGITGALMLGKDALTASCLGVYIHGSAADLCCLKNSTDVIKATDLIPYIREAIRRIQEN